MNPEGDASWDRPLRIFKARFRQSGADILSNWVVDFQYPQKFPEKAIPPEI